LETDILMGQQTGMLTAVTLTGVSKEEDVLSAAKPPDFTIRRLSELVELIAPSH
jgi:ribonucleotide monophosphatase NagD (HAD superfamily)